jgi:prepilin peptidase CpaA
MAPFRFEHLAILGALLALAACADVARRRVPNAIAVALLVAGVAAQWAAGGWRAAAAAGAVALAVGAALVLPWTMRLVGGGDLKLAAATAAWMGTGRVGTFLLATALAGGAVAIPFLRGARATVAELVLTAAGGRGGGGGPASAPARRVPLAVAIAVGAAVAAAAR